MVSDLFKVVLMYAGGWVQLTDYYKNQADHTVLGHALINLPAQ